MDEAMNAANVSIGSMKPPAAPELSQLDDLCIRLGAKLAQLDKACMFNMEEFRQIDQVANKLNGDKFWKNFPNDTGSQTEPNGNKMAPEPIRSGIILTLYNCIESIDRYTRELDRFSGTELRQTVNFFKEQI